MPLIFSSLLAFLASLLLTTPFAFANAPQNPQLGSLVTGADNIISVQRASGLNAPFDVRYFDIVRHFGTTDYLITFFEVHARSRTSSVQRTYILRPELIPASENPYRTYRAVFASGLNEDEDIEFIYFAVNNAAGNQADNNAGQNYRVLLANLPDYEERTQRKATEYLDKLVGHFARGESLVYYGRFTGSDNAGLVFPEGPAIAGLTYVQGSEYLANLIVTNLDNGSRVELTQNHENPRETCARVSNRQYLLSFLYPDINASCKNCVSNLWDRPQTLDVEFLAKIHVRGPYERRSVVRGTGSLTVKDASLLTFADLSSLSEFREPSAVLENEFTVAEADRIKTWYGEPAVKSLALPAGSRHRSCFEKIFSSAELFINAEHIANFGVRNYRQYEPEYYCCDMGDCW